MDARSQLSWGVRQRPEFMRSRHLLGLALVASAVGCGEGRAFKVDVADEAQLRLAVLDLVPLGTRLDSARRILEARHFSCITLERLPGTPWDLTCLTPVSGGVPLIQRELVVTFVSRDTFWMERPVDGARIRGDSLVLAVQRTD